MKKKLVAITFVMMFFPGAIPAQNSLQKAETPRVIKAVAPDYPPIAKAAHLEGEFKVDATIDGTGAVVAIDILNHPPTLKILREAVEKAAVQWKFESSGKTPEKRKVQLSFIFRFVPEKEAAITFMPPYQVEVTGYKLAYENPTRRGRNGS